MRVLFTVARAFSVCFFSMSRLSAHRLLVIVVVVVVVVVVVIIVVVVVVEVGTDEYCGERKLAQKKTHPEKHA